MLSALSSDTAQALLCAADSWPNPRQVMIWDGEKPDDLLRRLHDRETEMCVLKQRMELLLKLPGNVPVDEEGVRSAVDIDGDDVTPGSPPERDDLLRHTAKELNNREMLKARLARMCRSQQHADTIFNRALGVSSVPASADGHTKALHSILAAPSPQPIPPHDGVSSAPRNAYGLSSSSCSRSARSATKAQEGSALTYRAFLGRLMRSESKGFVKAIRLFLFSILGNGGEAFPLSARPRSAARTVRWDTEDVEVYGSSFLVQRCAEFFLAMQNAMGVHPSWAALGYDSIVACREHLERYVMTKVHPLAYGGKLNGAADAAISSRLRELQFLTPGDLNAGVNSGDDAVLVLAQEELLKMGDGRCPGDMVSRVVRCCDIIFSLLDQGRRNRPRTDAGIAPPWRPDLDPAGTADDFLPVLIYVVLRANVPRLHSMCEYVQAFHSPVALMSRPGYCFVALRSAVEFLVSLDGATVGMSQLDFCRRAFEATGSTNVT